MEQLRPTEFTADEFFAWALDQPTGRFELDNGTVMAMAPERVEHTRAKRNVAIALDAAIRSRALPCELLPDGASVRVDARSVYEPDALVRCGPPAPGAALEVTDPVVIVEVISPSSRGIDTGSKLSGYLSLPSIRHYLIVDTGRRVVIHHQRADGGEVAVRIHRAGAIQLDPPGLAIEVADLLRDI